MSPVAICAIAVLFAAAATTSLLLLSNKVQVVADVAPTSTNIVSSLSNLPFDENGHLATHVLAYPASGPCKTLIEAAIQELPDMYSHVPIAVDGEAAKILFGEKLPPSAVDGTDGTSSAITNVAQCPAVCLERGVDSYLVGYPLPEKYYNPTENDEHTSFRDFVNSFSCGRVEVSFINYSPKVLNLYWVHPDGTRHFNGEFDRMETNTQFITTYIGHRFIAVDPDAEDEVLMDYTIEFNGNMGVSNHVNKHDEMDIREEVKSAMIDQWREHQRVTRTFSSLGFAKGRLPEDVFASMRAFYYNNRDPPHRLLEEWDSKGMHTVQSSYDSAGIWPRRCTPHNYTSAVYLNFSLGCP
jgi:hypothetical protein